MYIHLEKIYSNITVRVQNQVAFTYGSFGITF